MSRYDDYSRILDTLKCEARFREIPEHRERGEWLDFTSNDYMGLCAFMDSMQKEWLDACGNRIPSFSASASRLLALDQQMHYVLEDMLGNLYGRPALLFNSGYHANTGIISALNIPGTLFVADKLIHASMIDGLMSGRCNFKRFPHNDMKSLARILAAESANYSRIVVLTESIFSMDGDMAPLEELVRLREQYHNILLYVDEAHAFGVRGKQGLGLCEELGIIDRTDIIMCTLGKAACSSGAFCIIDDIMKRYLVNSARSFIFSTAMPPASQSWSAMTIRRLTGMDNDRQQLRRISVKLRDGLRNLGFDTPAGDTPIVPLMTGNATRALELSAHLRHRGILALPIRRPTVPPGGERLRFSLSAKLKDTDIDRLINALKEWNSLT